MFMHTKPRTCLERPRAQMMLSILESIEGQVNCAFTRTYDGEISSTPIGCHRSKQHKSVWGSEDRCYKCRPETDTYRLSVHISIKPLKTTLYTNIHDAVLFLFSNKATKRASNLHQTAHQPLMGILLEKSGPPAGGSRGFQSALGR